MWEGKPNPVLRGVFDGAKSSAPWPAGKVPTLKQLARFLDNPPKTYSGSTTKGRKVYRWVKTFSRQEMDRLVNAQHAIGSVVAIQVLDRGVSGRAKRVLFKGQDGEILIKGELTLRRLLGNLRSSMFIVTTLNDRWFFKGGGWGHGVGMCQYGAIGMAEAGKSARNILAKYFSGTKVRRVY